MRFREKNRACQRAGTVLVLMRYNVWKDNWCWYACWKGFGAHNVNRTYTRARNNTLIVLMEKSMVYVFLHFNSIRVGFIIISSINKHKKRFLK